MLMGGALLMTVLVLVALQVQPVRRCSATPPRRAARATAFLEPGLRLRQGGRRQRAADLLQQDGPALARHRAGARHGRPAAHPDPLLHRAHGPDRPRAACSGRSASSAPSTCSPWPSASARRPWSAARRSAAQNAGGNTAAPQLAQALGTEFFGGELGGVTFLADHRGGRVRHHPRRRRRPHPGLVVEPGARLLRQRDQEGPDLRTPGGRGRPGLRVRHRRGRRSCSASSPRTSTSPSWWRWRSRWPRRATCRRSCTRCSGSGSTPPARCAAIYGGLHLRRGAGVLLAGRVRARRPSMFPNHDWHWFPLSNPGIISIPFGFLCGWLGTMLSSETQPGQVRRAGGPLAHRRRRALSPRPSGTDPVRRYPPAGPRRVGGGPARAAPPHRRCASTRVGGRRSDA